MPSVIYTVSSSFAVAGGWPAFGQHEEAARNIHGSRSMMGLAGYKTSSTPEIVIASKKNQPNPPASLLTRMNS